MVRSVATVPVPWANVPRALVKTLENPAASRTSNVPTTLIRNEGHEPVFAGRLYKEPKWMMRLDRGSEPR